MGSAATARLTVPPPLVQGRDAKRREWGIAGAFGLAGVIWFVLLSGWLGVVPGAVITKRQNVLFNSDTSIWFGRMINHQPSLEGPIHPLEILFWRGPAEALAHMLGWFLPVEDAGWLAARLLVALVAGIGVGALALLAARYKMPLGRRVLLFAMYLLFTSSSTICLPEHFAISNGLLSLTFVIAALVTDSRRRTAWMTAMATLCGGTTITNVIFPAMAYVHFAIASMRRKLLLVAAGVPVAAGMAFALYKKSYIFHWFIGSYASFRIVHQPLRALLDSLYLLVVPAVGPPPVALRLPGWDMVTYEPAMAPLEPGSYLAIQGISALAWLALLLVSMRHGLRDEKRRPVVQLLLGWLLFSMVFHNIWGPEVMLLAPHWSWALMGLVILGAREISRRFLAITVVLVGIGQIATLVEIRRLLETITR
jgi:hypothetical protein